jgi:hypothetical protein
MCIVNFGVLILVGLKELSFLFKDIDWEMCCEGKILRYKLIGDVA